MKPGFSDNIRISRRHGAGAGILMAILILAMMICAGTGSAYAAAETGYKDGSLSVYFNEEKPVSIPVDTWNRDCEFVKDQQYTMCTGGGQNIMRTNEIHSGVLVEDVLTFAVNACGADWDTDELKDYSIRFTTSTGDSVKSTVGDLFSSRYTFGDSSSMDENIFTKVYPVFETDEAGKISLYVGMKSYSSTNGMFWRSDIVKVEIKAPGTDDDDIAAPDGDKSWYTGHENDSEYILNDNDDMLGLSSLVRGGSDGKGEKCDFAGKTLTLGKNITITGTWAPIGNADNRFRGTLNGNFKVVTFDNITVKGSYTGLFGYNAGTVKDLVTAGKITNKSEEGDFAGIVAGFNSGTITNTVNTAELSAESIYNTGGIAGFSTSGIWVDNRTGEDIQKTAADATGLIKHCANTGSITGWTKVGAMAGQNAGDIIECFNTGRIDAANNSSKNGVGGIAGRNGNNNVATETGNILSCYNTGLIGRQAQKWLGGMTGFNNARSSIKNCYDTGDIVSTLGRANPIAGQNEGVKNTVNNYSLKGLNSTSILAPGGPYEYELGKLKSEADMKSAEMVQLLGDAYAMDTEAVNDGFPVLSWQQGSDILRLAADPDAYGRDEAEKAENAARPGSVTGLKGASASYSSVKITWKKADRASGYEILRSTSSKGTYRRVATVSTTSYTNKSLTCGRTYYYKIVPCGTYTFEGETKTVKGAESAVVSARPSLGRPSTLKLTAGKKQVTVRWSRVSGASGYKVYRSTKKSSGYKLVKTVKGSSTVKYVNKKLTKGKRYYYKVRAYRTVSGKTVYGSLTSARSVRAK